MNRKRREKIVQLTILPDMESIHFFGAIPKPALASMSDENKKIISTRLDKCILKQ